MQRCFFTTCTNNNNVDATARRVDEFDDSNSTAERSVAASTREAMPSDGVAAEHQRSARQDEG